MSFIIKLCNKSSSISDKLKLSSLDDDCFSQMVDCNLESVNWKVDQDTWIVLSKSDIQTVFNSIVTHVQSAFDWEVVKLAEIVATTHETLPTLSLE